MVSKETFAYCGLAMFALFCTLIVYRGDDFTAAWALAALLVGAMGQFMAQDYSQTVRTIAWLFQLASGLLACAAFLSFVLP